MGIFPRGSHRQNTSPVGLTGRYFRAWVPRGSVLPDSIRRFSVGLGDKTTSIGKYTVAGNFGYGSGGQLVSASTSFFVLPSLYIGLAVALLIVLILAAVIFPRMLRTHDRKLLRKVRRGKN